MSENNNKKFVKNISSLALIIALSTAITYGMLSLTTPLNSKTAQRNKRTLDYINKDKYSISDLVAYKNSDGTREILLGNVPGVAQYYDITDNNFYRVLKTRDINGKFLNTIYTDDIYNLAFVIPADQYKKEYTKEEIIELENELNSQYLVRKID